VQYVNYLIADMKFQNTFLFKSAVPKHYMSII